MENINRFCQSCGMPMPEDSLLGKEKDGSLNTDYCMYCYKDGAFTTDEDMDSMIESCIPHVIGGQPYPDADTARAEMHKFFPQLKRWKQAKE